MRTVVVLLVMDLSQLPNSVSQYSFIYTDANGYQQTDGHELWIDEKGRLFIIGGAYWNAGATIFDLTVDPINPPYLGAYENHYIHSAYVRVILCGLQKFLTDKLKLSM
jgi:hypothetical protein